MPLIAQVAVDRATIHFDKLYSYRVPPALAGRVHEGSMVLAPFGRGAPRARMGVVLRCEQAQEAGEPLKELLDAAPDRARLSPELLGLVYALHDQTFCTYYEAVRAVIPYGAQYRAVQENGAWKLERQLTRDVQRAYRLAENPPENAGKLTEKQRAALAALGGGAKALSEMEAQGTGRAVLEALCKKGLVRRVEQPRALAVYENYQMDEGEVLLSDSQQRAFEQLRGLLGKGPSAALLHGVTASGKTLVFLKLIEQAIAAKRQVLVLVPEISLTPQMIYRLKRRFGERVAVQHSALSHTERLLQWQQIQDGRADIVVGTRSAVFAPLSDIGLIIIDEEQEHTYHSENAPRYLAHDIAKRRAVTHGALLVLASATPSTESYYSAVQGRYHLVELPERYRRMPLPSVEMVDMREELRAGNAGSISARLAAEMRENLARGEQTILLLNRRGYKTVGMCAACGEVIRCDACSVPMVYHKAEGRLLCHYCGKAVEPVPQVCPHCGGRIRYTGFGTQRVEEELAALLPAARVLRMDLDTTQKKHAHETMLAAFARGEYDIMLGTQMVAKGLDFEKVTLVGVLGIDQMLFAQGYKAYENVFSLVTQVIGRGGRAQRPGRALIQTVDPQHPVLAMAARQDYRAFFDSEIRFRRLNLYPPFCAICMAAFQGPDEAAVYAAARAFAGFVQREAESVPNMPLRILGPAPMNIAMVNRRYRFKLTLKCRANADFRAMLRRALDDYNREKWPAKAGVSIDFHADADV